MMLDELVMHSVLAGVCATHWEPSICGDVALIPL